MRSFLRITALLAILALAGAMPAAAESYKDAISYTALATELGNATPTGAGVLVTQVEAGTNYFPNIGDSEFSGKDIRNISNTSSITSGHATTVGQDFYGSTTSIAPGINQIDVYSADAWLGTGYLNTGSGDLSLASTSRVANHSWVGSYATSQGNSEALRRLDWVIATDDYIQVVAMNNGSGTATYPLLGSSFNAIAVGLSNGSSEHGSYVLDTSYTAGRTRPDIVAPMSATSFATPVVASAAALLVQTGHQDPSLSRDPLVNFTTNRYTDQYNDGQKIYNAERSEVVKAALMAGADRSSFANYSTTTTTNGLDSTYGAGQVNIYNSYHIIAAGEFNSSEDLQVSPANIQRYGFDYDPYFGGLSDPQTSQASNTTGSYYFHTGSTTGTLTASLVWNLNIDDSTLNATLYNLDLYLYLINGDMNTLVTKSASIVDNTENIYFTSLLGDQDYLLEVVLGQNQSPNFLWDYGLAWDITNAVPLPGTWLLFGSGLAALGFFRVSRRRPS